MISQAYNFILLHVPKTGGNSIQSLLLSVSDDEIITNQHQDGHNLFGIKGTITPYKHATLSDYKAIMGDAVFDYKIAITLRDPLQRALSYYHMPRRWIKTNKDGSVTHIPPVWNEDEFLKLLTEIKPTSDFLEVDGRYIKPDYLINLESLQEDFSYFCKALELPFNGDDLPHRNKSSYASNFQPNRDITPKIISAVKENFAKDYAMFDYN